MKKHYDAKLKKQRRLLLDEVQDYAGDNMFINELVANLRKHTETPVMVVRKPRTHRKKKKRDRGGIKTRKKKRFKHPEEGVYSVMDFLGV